MCKPNFPNQNIHKKTLNKKEKENPKPSMTINVCLLDLLTVVDEIIEAGSV